MTVHDLLRQAKLEAGLADFILEEVPQWLDESEDHVLRQAADVVVGLDDARDRALGGRLAALDDVWIGGALDHEVDVAELGSGLFEDPHEGAADDLSLRFGVRNAPEFS